MVILAADQSIFIPPELIEIIIAFVGSDKDTLQSCSLVCHSLLHASRVQLFRRLSLKSSNYKKFFNHLELDPGQIPRLTQYCKVLNLVNAEWLFEADGRGLGEVITHFSPSLTTLSIHNTTIPSCADLLKVVLPFPGMRSLGLNDIRLASPVPISPSATITISPFPSSIKTLAIRNSNCLGQIMTFVMAHKVTFEGIANLIIDITFTRDFTAIGQYYELPHVAIGLERLSVSIPCAYDHIVQYCPDDPLAQNPIHISYRKLYGLTISPYLRQLCGLRELRICNFIDTRQADQGSALFWTPRTLASITSPVLRRVSLTMFLERSGQLDEYGVNWGFLDEIFNSETYLEVETITFERVGGADISGCEDVIIRRLKRCEARGILRFRSIDWDSAHSSSDDW